MKSLLILSATAGAGHVRAAEALAAAAGQLESPVAVRHEDILDFTSPLFKKLYSEFYFGVVQTSPELWGYFYKKSGREPRPRIKPPLLKLFDQFNYRKYLRMIGSLKPDAMLCTHFLPYLAISEELASRTWKIPVFSVPTDYDVHGLWISPHVAKYYAATREAAWTLRSHSVPEERIAVTGIPVMPQFAVRHRREQARREFGLAPSARTIMLLSGGYGIGVMDELVRTAARFAAGVAHRTQLIVVCGKNETLYRTLRRMRHPAAVRVALFRYVPFVDRLMDCAEVLITKSGGLTVSEALAKRLPMIIFDPFPGQEGRNADYLTEQGAALRASGLANLEFKLGELLAHPSRLAAMRASAGKIAAPHAARRILEDLLATI